MLTKDNNFLSCLIQIKVSENKYIIDSKWQTFLHIEYGIKIPPSKRKSVDSLTVNE